MTVNNVPLLDLNAQYEPMKDDIIQTMTEVFNSKRFINGPKVDELETKMADYCGAKYAIAVSSGTDALIVSLMALEIGAGDEVITTPFTFFATAGCIARVGAKPVFVDIDPETFNIDSKQIEAKITPKTKAIMPVHLFGQMADMDPILSIAQKHNLYVIEDAAQAIGSTYYSHNLKVEKKAGSMGTIGCFSFFPSKNLGACGDAGAVTTNDEALAKKIKALRMHGESQRFYHDYIGGIFRIDALQAALLLVKLPYLEAQHKGRIANAKYYDINLANLVQTPKIHTGCKTIYNQYTIRTQKRDQLLKHLQDQKIGCAVYYPVCLHEQKCFAYLGYKPGDFPASEKAAQEVLALPVYAELTNEQKAYVVAGIKSFFA